MKNSFINSIYFIFIKLENPQFLGKKFAKEHNMIQENERLVLRRQRDHAAEDTDPQEGRARQNSVPVPPPHQM